MWEWLEFELVCNYQNGDVFLGLTQIHGLKNLQKIGRLKGIYSLNDKPSKGTSELLFEQKILGHTFQNTLGNFFQVNGEQNQKLIEMILNLSDAHSGILNDKVVWDLYSGNGNISIPLAPYCQKILCLEENPKASQNCKQNAIRNGVDNVFCFTGKVEDRWSEILLKHGPPGLIILDPPRRGAKEIITKLFILIKECNYKPKIIYISCDLPCLARDAREIILGGYQITEGVMVDMFPQTYLLETVLVFQ